MYMPEPSLGFIKTGYSPFTSSSFSYLLFVGIISIEAGLNLMH